MVLLSQELKLESTAESLSSSKVLTAWVDQRISHFFVRGLNRVAMPFWTLG
ncbi:MAG TPA: hypothetical protein VJ372_24190 [Pyrinomonadaceae bacterium]|nr:hypothetical protein [Pyrinomonadaceae bacterium]